MVVHVKQARNLCRWANDGKVIEVDRDLLFLVGVLFVVDDPVVILPIEVGLHGKALDEHPCATATCDEPAV